LDAETGIMPQKSRETEPSDRARDIQTCLCAAALVAYAANSAEVLGYAAGPETIRMNAAAPRITLMTKLNITTL